MRNVVASARFFLSRDDGSRGSGPHLLEHLLMIIDEVAQLKRKTIKTLPAVESALLMSGSVPGPALQPVLLTKKKEANGGDACL